MNMAAKVSALRAEIGRRESQVDALLTMLSREPDDARRTGRIKGEDSRYSLRVWYWRNSGCAMALLTHHHAGQSDHVSGPFPLDAMRADYRFDSVEGAAICAMIDGAVSAHRASERVADPVPA